MFDEAAVGAWKQRMYASLLEPRPAGCEGDFGWSFEFDRPVSEIVGDALWLTVLVNLAAVLFVYAVALPLGVLAAAAAALSAAHSPLAKSRERRSQRS